MSAAGINEMRQPPTFVGDGAASNAAAVASEEQSATTDVVVAGDATTEDMKRSSSFESVTEGVATAAADEVL